MTSFAHWWSRGSTLVTQTGERLHPCVHRCWCVTAQCTHRQHGRECRLSSWCVPPLPCQQGSAHTGVNTAAGCFDFTPPPFTKQTQKRKRGTGCADQQMVLGYSGASLAQKHMISPPTLGGKPAASLAACVAAWCIGAAACRQESAAQLHVLMH